MTTAMHRDAEVDEAATASSTGRPGLGGSDPLVLDLSDSALTAEAQSLHAAAPVSPGSIDPEPIDPEPIDVESLARMAAEVAVSVARHREELAAAMAELTALQRTLRGEVRTVIAELDRIANGVAPDAVDGANGAAVPALSDPGSGRRSITARLRRAR